MCRAASIPLTASGVRGIPAWASTGDTDVAVAWSRAWLPAHRR
jgi:hypothetical protein